MKTELHLLSVVIPAHNEEGSVGQTLRHLHETLASHRVPHEIVVVDDNSSDATWSVLQEVSSEVKQVRPVSNPGVAGFGRAVQVGLDSCRGDGIVIMMADESDDPEDVVRYWQLLGQFECVFGSRFVKDGKVVDYPKLKLVLNRLANLFVKALFGIKLNDTTNAFKAYRREVIEGCRPFLSPHFNLTVEIPLKAIVRGYSWTVTPISWRNRKQGESKLRPREMGSRYFFIVMYVWLEKYFSRGDYRRTSSSDQRSA